MCSHKYPIVNRVSHGWCRDLQSGEQAEASTDYRRNVINKVGIIAHPRHISSISRVYIYESIVVDMIMASDYKIHRQNYYLLTSSDDQRVLHLDASWVVDINDRKSPFHSEYYICFHIIML